MRNIGTISRELRKSYHRLGRWRAVGAAYGITAGMAWRIARQGYEPKDPLIRIKLELPARAMAPVCRRCGAVHVSKRCSRSRRRVYRDLSEMPVELLRWQMENREVMDEM
jgi:hypothetical protein